jgi:hypothetical protein
MNERKIVIDTFVGIPHERVKVRGRIIKRICREKWGKGAKSLYVVLTDNSNVITFNSPGKFTVGAEYDITGIVKRHRTFGNKNQTHLSDWTITKHFERKRTDNESF